MNITDTVKLLELDEDLTFDIHMAQLGSYAVAQLNAISRLNRYLAKFEKASILNSFVYVNFNYCPQVWHCCSCYSTEIIENIQKRYPRILLVLHKK